MTGAVTKTNAAPANKSFFSKAVTRIKNLRKSYKTLGDRAHNLLCDLLEHYVAHEDPQLFTMFMAEMEKTSIDRRAVAQWHKDYAALDYVKGKKGWHCKPMRDDDGNVLRPTEDSHKEGVANPFYALDGNKNVNPKPLDLLKKLKADVNAYPKRIEDPDNGDVVTVVRKGQIEKLTQVIHSLELAQERQAETVEAEPKAA